jgi:hypothetical protein
MKPSDPTLVAARNNFFDKLKELEDARKLYVESGKPLPDGFLTMHTARDGWRINFLRMPANLYVSRRPKAVPSALPSSPAWDFLQQIQGGPAATPVAPVPSTGGLGGPVGGGGSVISGGGFVGTVNDWIAQNPVIGKANLSIYGEISLVKTYSSDIMVPYWIDGAAGFVFNFNALQNPQITANGRSGYAPMGVPGSDLAMTFETKNQGPLNTPYTYVLFYRLVRIGDEIIKQKITYEQFMEYGEKRKYWEQGWSPLAGQRWELNPGDAWKDAK